MNCQDIANLLDEFDELDLSAEQREAVELHLASCANCAHAWLAQETLSRQSIPSASPELRARVFEPFAAQGHESRSDGLPAGLSMGPRVRWGVAMLACVGVAVVLVQYGGDDSTVAPATSTGEMADTLAPEDPVSDNVIVLPGVVPVDPGSVAVMPFEDLSAGPLDDGIPTALLTGVLNELSLVPGIYTREAQAVMPYADSDLSPQDVAAQLGVRGIVEGSVRYDDSGRIRITYRLIDASTGMPLLASTYDRLLVDLSDIQADIAAGIATALTVAVGPQSVENRTLVWMDRNGVEEPLNVPPRAYTSVSVSPDGGRVAVSVLEDGNEDIWIFDLMRATLARLTFDDAADALPAFSPDGQSVAYWSSVGQLRRIAANASSTPIVVADVSERPAGLRWSPDGTLLFDQSDGIYSVSSNGGMAAPLIAAGFDHGGAVVSPDGQWLAYHSSESGRFEIFARPFPRIMDGKWQLSNRGGTEPLWSPDGRRLYYRESTNLMAVNVETDPRFLISVPERFAAIDQAIIGNPTFDISPDGQRFIMIKGADVSAEIQDLDPAERQRLCSLGYINC